MISSIVNLVLLAALAGTSAAVLMMYRRLRRFDVLQGEAAKEFARTAAALDRAREAIGELAADGGEMAVTLAARLNEARIVMNDIDEATLRTRDALLPEPQPQPQPVHNVVHMVPAPPPPPAYVGTVAVELAADEPPAEDAAPALSAAIRIRNAARARIDAAKAKAANLPQPARPTPGPTLAPLPERLTPTIHHAEPALPGEAAVRRGRAPAPLNDDRAEGPHAWPEAVRVTWHDLARAAQLAS